MGPLVFGLLAGAMVGGTFATCAVALVAANKSGAPEPDPSWLDERDRATRALGYEPSDLTDGFDLELAALSALAAEEARCQFLHGTHDRKVAAVAADMLAQIEDDDRAQGTHRAPHYRRRLAELGMGAM